MEMRKKHLFLFVALFLLASCTTFNSQLAFENELRCYNSYVQWEDYALCIKSKILQPQNQSNHISDSEIQRVLSAASQTNEFEKEFPGKLTDKDKIFIHRSVVIGAIKRTANNSGAQTRSTGKALSAFGQGIQSGAPSSENSSYVKDMPPVLVSRRPISIGRVECHYSDGIILISTSTCPPSK
ncbi:MAG: hypothetical protein RLO12_01545 [Fulvivirga sp.]